MNRHSKHDTEAVSDYGFEGPTIFCWKAIFLTLFTNLKILTTRTVSISVLVAWAAPTGWKGQVPPVPYALSPAAPSRREKKLYVSFRPFPPIVAA